MPTLTRPVAFWLVGGVLALFMAAAAAPSPSYVVHQSELGFSALTLTLVFGVYSLTLLVALVTVGSVSDHVGRRPVLVGALLAGAGAMVLFLLPSATGWLLVAFVLLAVGVLAGVPARHGGRRAGFRGGDPRGVPGAGRAGRPA